MRARSRSGGGIGASVVLQPLTFHAPASVVAPAPAGDAIFAPTANPTCPPGQHWEDTTTTTLKGLGACVPDTVSVTPLVLRPAAPSTAAAAPAPASTTTATCPAPWSLWWLVVAFGAGAAAGHYAVKNQKAVKKNAGRIANAAAGRLVNAGVARLLG